MTRRLRLLRESRVTRGHLMLVTGVSLAVSAVIVVSALGESPAERAVIAALRQGGVVHASQPNADTGASIAPPGGASSAPALSAPDSTGGGSAAAGGAGGGGGSSGSGSTAAGGGTVAVTASSPANPAPAAAAAASHASRIKHVFVIPVSAGPGDLFDDPSTAGYVTDTLRPRGVTLSYDSLGSGALADLLAMVSGQPPNVDTARACPTYADFPPGAAPGKDGLVTGSGCVYPNTAITIADQLDGSGLSWRAYVDAMSSPCQHPNSGADETASGDGYAATENPFVYFHSLLDLGGCQADDLPLGQLSSSLKQASRTPSLSFVAPDPCDAGVSDACPAPATSGAPATDAFLKSIVPQILSAPGYKQGGALLIVSTGPSSATVGSSRHGALVLSPFVHAGSAAKGNYNAYSVLRTLEDIFGLTPLGRAGHARGFEDALGG